MADIQGVLTTLNNRLPDGIDASRLAQWLLRGGRSYSDVRTDVANAFSGLNEEILLNWGDLVFVTEDDHMEYPNGGSLTPLPVVTELDTPQTYKSETIGHMIDLLVRAGSIGGTWRFFRDMRENVLLANIRDMVQRGRNALEQHVLQRCLTNIENPLGSSGFDVPFANASPGTLKYIPPAYNGKVFADTHNHYLGFDSGSSLTLADMLIGLAETIHEHGHYPPFVAYVSEADAKDYRLLADFIRPVDASVTFVDKGAATTGANFYSTGVVGGTNLGGGRFIGGFSTPFGDVELRATSRIPSRYAFMYKSYGINDPRNPIALRVHPSTGFGFRIREYPSNEIQYPVSRIDIEIEYGISCGMNRTSGAAGYLVNGGTWVNPTIA